MINSVNVNTARTIGADSAIPIHCKQRFDGHFVHSSCWQINTKQQNHFFNCSSLLLSFDCIIDADPLVHRDIKAQMRPSSLSEWKKVAGGSRPRIYLVLAFADKPRIRRNRAANCADSNPGLSDARLAAASAAEQQSNQAAARSATAADALPRFDGEKARARHPPLSASLRNKCALHSMHEMSM